MATTTLSPPENEGKVLGFPVSTRNMEGTLSAIEGLLSDGGSHIVATADSSGLVIAQTDSELASIYRSASLVTADSNGVVWALKRGGYSATRVSGVDVADQLCRLSSEKGYRIFLLGSSPGVADEAAERLRLKYPGCNIVGSRNGFFPASDDDIVAQEIALAKPDILFVAMGIPRQEKFLAKTLAITGAKIGMGVGGSLDVFSGRVKRAPKLIQKIKLEWLWRVLLNPKKFGKVMLLPKFMMLVWRYREP